ncbi:hypothetical protein HYPBUDRAFT_153598 [Hyphopichia burtonii NRRL Y-1933]|uniref:Uncharacterized protein n=1 Tax=Hyphopichia burtonii NRRL Y-1933 TaxID=984485 RepID=A0A1E4RFP5_9ASCO|nr:hypothetical protein HYPBUDRAFT_153598 [Hyphopichia burtonii NRRL Y-1933]ODV66073.1 hypothetical protein HYPBUDRAFT_153598 [Hyphopichia burtonii NRRL Y-1933]
MKAGHHHFNRVELDRLRGNQAGQTKKKGRCYSQKGTIQRNLSREKGKNRSMYYIHETKQIDRRNRIKGS